MLARSVIFVVISVVLAVPAVAYDKLSAKAKPIPASELKSAYAGKTVR